MKCVWCHFLSNSICHTYGLCPSCIFLIMMRFLKSQFDHNSITSITRIMLEVTLLSLLCPSLSLWLITNKFWSSGDFKSHNNGHESEKKVISRITLNHTIMILKVMWLCHYDLWCSYKLCDYVIMWS